MSSPKQFRAPCLVGGPKRVSPRARGAIDLATRLAIAQLGRAQVPLLFEAVQQGVEGSRADPVAVAANSSPCQAENRLPRTWCNTWRPDQSRVEVAVIREISMIDFRFRHSNYE